MNKKMNTLLFIFGATVFNVLVAVISFIGFMFLYARYVMVLVPEESREWGFALIFLLSIAVSFIVYRYLLKFLLKKIDIEKYFDPLFVRKYRKK
jgi:hypothetical protein